LRKNKNYQTNPFFYLSLHFLFFQQFGDEDYQQPDGYYGQCDEKNFDGAANKPDKFTKDFLDAASDFFILVFLIVPAGFLTGCRCLSCRFWWEFLSFLSFCEFCESFSVQFKFM